MDNVSLLSSAVGLNESAAANERQIAVAANANRTAQDTAAVLLEAIQQSAAYGATGTATHAVAGTRFAGVA